jgi:fatty-acyl-CoA synthase
MPTIAELLAARSGDDRPGILFEDERHSWDDVVRAGAVRAAVAQELHRDDRPFHVGVLLENVPEYLFWMGAAAFSGATVVGINPTRRGAELAADIRHSDCELIVTDESQAAILDGLDHGVANDGLLVVDNERYGALLAAHAGASIPSNLPGPDALLLLLFTSGSTGAPKAVICSQGRLASIAGRTPAMFDIDRGSVCYESMPLFHGNAIMANWAPALEAGAAVALRRRFSASGFLPDVRRFGATFFNYVGRSLAYVLATPESADDADNSLRVGFGTEASARDMERFSRRFGCRLIENYGSSEGAVTINKVPGSPEQALGLPPPGVEVAIFEPATGRECARARFDVHGGLANPDEAIGEIVGLNTARAFEGYYRNDDANSERVREGVFWTGDLGYRDDAGYFYFAGRSADWLRVDSENFAAAPIERILSNFPGVVMCAVYPVPDPRTGDQVMAALELEEGATFRPEDLDGFLAGHPDLGTKWAPRFVRVTALIPLTASNKVHKPPLRRVGWGTDEPVWWKPAPGESYRRLTPEDVDAMRTEFAHHGRSHMVDAG